MYYQKRSGYAEGKSYARQQKTTSADYQKKEEFSGFIGCTCQGTGCRGTCRTPKGRY